MNRREFCLSLGAAVVGGGVFARGSTPATVVEQVKPDLHNHVRAKMIYPESWHNRFAFLSVSEQAKHLREELFSLTGQFDILIFNDNHVSPDFVALFHEESSRAGMDLYIPGRFSSSEVGLFSQSSVYRVCWDRGLEDCFGFLVSTRESLSRFCGLILCDKSRCRWRTFRFLSQATDIFSTSVQKPLDPPPALQTAQWIDAAQKHLAFCQVERKLSFNALSRTL